MFVILLASLTANSTVLGLVYLHKKLRYRSVLVTLGVVVADILTTIVWVFQAEASIIAGKWPFEQLGCSIMAYFYIALLYVRWCEIFTLTLDRFCQILFPFYYKKRAPVVLIVLTVLSWVIPAITGLMVPIIGNSSFYLTLTACSVSCGDDRTCSNSVTILFGIFFLIGGIIPTIFYIIIYIYGRIKKRRMQRTLYMGTGEGIPNNTNSYRISSQERRALTTCVLVFITTILSTIPVYITSALRGGSPELFDIIPIEVHFVFTYIFLLGTILDPMVVMRNKDFRVLLRKSLCCKGEKVRGTVSLGLKSILAQSFTSGKNGSANESKDLSQAKKRSSSERYPSTTV